MQNAIDKINPEIPADSRLEALRNVLRVQHSTLLANNEAFHKLLTEGVDVKGREASEIKDNLPLPKITTSKDWM